MRRMAGWMGVLWLVAGCTVPGVGELPGTCTSDPDCGEGAKCDVGAGICYRADEELPDGGECTPACAEYEACTRNGCRPRFTAVNIVSPVNNAVVSGGMDGGTVQVVAELVANPLYEKKFPPSLSFSATPSGGGGAGSFGAVTRDGGTYSAPWTPPATQTQVDLTVAHPLPAVGLSGTITVTVDLVSPTFDIAFMAPATRSPGSAGAQADQRDPTVGFDAAYRRDESITVVVSANETVTNVGLTIVGIAAGGGEGQTQTVALQPATTCSGGPAFCGTATVDLSKVEMNAFRGTMHLRVEGQDGAGNRGSASKEVKVTRWRWAFNSGGTIKGSPAVGDKGSIYFGTAETSGKFFALRPDGSLKWELALGLVAGSPTVGAPRSVGEEYVYFAARNAIGTVLYAYRGDNKTQVARCPGSGTFSTSLVESALALGESAVDIGSGLTNVETAVGIINSSSARIVGIRPDALFADQCISLTGAGSEPIPPTTAGASVVMKNNVGIFYGANATAGPRLTSYSSSFGSNTPRANWPVNTSYVPFGLALLGDSVYGGQPSAANPPTGSLFSAPQTPVSSGTVASVIYPSGNAARVHNPAMGEGNFAYFGTENVNASALVRIALDSPAAPQVVSSPATLRAAPVVGEGERLYTVAYDGRVTAWATSNLAENWSMTLPNVGSVDVSPTLDCQRDNAGNAVPSASLGTLYVTAGTSLYSFIVDSPGLAPNAPWPRYQHDARNTGNPATPITNCP